MDEIDRDEPIYEAQVPIKLCMLDREEKIVPLVVRILSGYKVIEL